MATTKKAPVAKKEEAKKAPAKDKTTKKVTTSKPTPETKNVTGEEKINYFDFDNNNDVIPADDDEEVVIETKKKEISQAGYNKLLEELKRLEDYEIPMVNNRIKEAREFGDLSENAEYQSALNEKQMLDVRIAELKEIVLNSLIVETIKKGDTVQYGSVVTLEIPERNETVVVTVIGSAEITYEEDLKHISFDSPVGLAIEGKKVGDICKVRAERGRFDVKIVAIK
jgi:transcription elongation factor GreA